MFQRWPKIRIVFVIGYLLSIVQFWRMANPIIFNILVSLLMLFGAYLSLVMAGIFHDKNAKKINDVAFDLLGIAFIVFSFTANITN